MPHTVEPYVVLIAKTTTIDKNIKYWLERKGVEDKYIDTILSPSKTDAEKLVEVMGRRCYMSFQPNLNPNVKKIREDIAVYINNILDSKHGSVVEHVSFTFAIEDVSRVFTGEMNRHRAGTAISEGSMRYIRYRDIPYWTPHTFIGNTPSTGRWQAFESKEKASQKILNDVFTYVQNSYIDLEDIWAEELNGSDFHKKKILTSAMRRIVPMGVASGGGWSGNIRALRHIFEMRCTEAAEEEICLVGGMMLLTMMATEPLLFGDFTLDEFGFAKPKYSKI